VSAHRGEDKMGQDRRFESGEGKVMENGLFEMCNRGRKLSIWAEF
jgi:hypothetical protein